MQVNALDLNTAALDPDVRFTQKFRVIIPFYKERVNRLYSTILG
jgi:hypothetical protein